MSEREPAWKKWIREHLYGGETYESAEDFYVNIDPGIQEILDAKRLIEVGSNARSEEEIQIGALRLKNVVVNILGSPNAREHRGYQHAISELITVRTFFREDPQVQEIAKQFLGGR